MDIQSKIYYAIINLMKKFFLIILVTSLFLLNNCSHPEYLTRRGDYATGYSDSDENTLKWLSKFNIVEIGGVGDIANSSTISFLKERGVRNILCYDWMPAVYYYIEEENNVFVNWIFKNRYYTSLNPEGPFPHTEEMGYSFARDYYLDFGVFEVIDRKGKFISNFVSENGYGGIFFDWASGVYINEDEYKPLKNRFNKLHPGLSYLSAVGNFYNNLSLLFKKKNLIIATNQGYRNPENVLPYVNYDMAESYIVGYDYFGKYLEVKGRGFVKVPQTQYFPVSMAGKESFKDTLFYLNRVKNILNNHKGEDFSNFIYLNYAAPDFIFNKKEGKYIPTQPKDAIFLSYSTAKLTGTISYLEVPFDRKLERNDIYFLDLGKATGDNYKVDESNKFAIRFYQYGFVLVYYGEELNKEIKVQDSSIPDGCMYYDFYKKEWLRADGKSISIKIETKRDPLTKKTIPAGRVMVYGKN